jgi:hypothetical protein
VSWPEQRRAELDELRHNDPAKLIALYRGALVADELAPLPPSLSLEQIVESVMLYEMIKGSNSCQLG